MTPQPLSRVVNSFLIKWLFLPSAALVLAGTILVFLHLDRTERNEQRIHARSTARYINSYFQQVEEDILYLLNLSQNQEAFGREIEYFQEAKSLYRKILLMDGEGFVHQSAPGRNGLRDFSGLLPGSIQSGKTVFTPTYQSLDSDTVVVGIARSSPSGMRVLIELNLFVLQNYISELTDSSEKYYTFITDSFGNVLAHPDRSLVERQVNVGYLELFSLEKDSGFFMLRNRLLLMSSADVPFAGWRVVVAEDVFSIFSPVVLSILGFLLLISILFMLIGSTIKFQILDHIVKPLASFSKIVEGFHSKTPSPGSLESVKWEQTGFEELYSLNRSFIKMQAAVAHREEEIRSSEKELKAALKEKETLLQEMHHRVKNNLNVVASLLSLQSDQVKTVGDARRALEASRNRIYSMAMIHEDLYKTDSFSRVNMESYIRKMLSQLVGYYGKDSSVRLHVEAEDTSLDIVHAVPCGIIINELVTNSLKYAFPENRQGLIKIRFSLDTSSKSYVLEVIDDGIGLPEDFSMEGAESLGLELVKILSTQLDGELSFHSDGTTLFRLLFPAVE